MREGEGLGPPDRTWSTLAQATPAFGASPSLALVFVLVLVLYV